MDWMHVLPEDELPEGQRRVVQVDGRSILVVRHQGEVLAMASTCPHQGSPLERGRITADGVIVCLTHQRAFDLRTGAAHRWSPWPGDEGRVTGVLSRERALQTYPTRLAEGSIWIGLDDL